MSTLCLKPTDTIQGLLFILVMEKIFMLASFLVLPTNLFTPDNVRVHMFLLHITM
jgi:hypothetical protein